MKTAHLFTAKPLSLYIAAALGCAMPLAARAVPVLQAQAGYNVPGTNNPGATPVSGSPQSSDTSVDILDFFTVNNVSMGVHTYGSTGTFTQFGNRVSSDVSGTGSYDLDGVLVLTLNDVGPTFSFNVIPGEVSATGSTGFVSGEFVNAHLNLSIEVNGTQVFMSDAVASASAGGVANASFTGADLGYSCSGGTSDGLAGCSLSGGPFSLDLPSLLGGAAPTYDLVYTLSAEVHGNITQDHGDCGGFYNGSGPQPATFAVGSGGNGGKVGAPCGSIARSGDPLPEPGSLALAGLGLAALSAVRRRKARPSD